MYVHGALGIPHYSRLTYFLSIHYYTTVFCVNVSRVSHAVYDRELVTGTTVSDVD